MNMNPFAPVSINAFDLIPSPFLLIVQGKVRALPPTNLLKSKIQSSILCNPRKETFSRDWRFPGSQYRQLVFDSLQILGALPS